MNEQQPEYSREFDEIHQQELAWISQRRKTVNMDENTEQTVGLAFSGGGIRSATFNLGILQGLQDAKLLDQVDYLSTVSGGGYIGSCFSWIRSRVAAGDSKDVFIEPTDKAENTVLDWLRSHGKYLIAGRGTSGWTLAASIIAGTGLNLLVMMPILLLMMELASKDWLGLSWPAWLHLPGVSEINGHDGFMLFVLAGLSCLVLYVVTVLVFALISGIRAIRVRAGIVFTRLAMGWLLSSGVILVMLGLLPVLTAIDESAMPYLQSEFSSSLTKHLSYIGPILTGIAALYTANSSSQKTGKSRSGLASFGLIILIIGFLIGLYHLASHTSVLESPEFFVLLGLSLFLSFFCDINWVSMHSYYRGKLAAAYMPPIRNNTGTPLHSGAAQHFKVSEINPAQGGPLHLINTTMNTINSKLERLNGRGGENFTISPLYSGSTATGYRKTDHYMRGEMYLSTAFTISGAAVDPNMYATRSRPISFLMALLNFRLGYWAQNPEYAFSRIPKPHWYRFLLREMLGIGLSETQKQIHLSDGGHFENLGLYELLRRRCKYIIVCDAGADPETNLDSLGQAAKLARVDFNANVDIQGDRLYQESQKELSDCPFLLGTVTYADGSTGEILYIKPMMQQGLTVDLYAYWRANPTFPNQSTADQFFGERQFEAYRQLGLQIVQRLTADCQAQDIAQLLGRAKNLYQKVDPES